MEELNFNQTQIAAKLDVSKNAVSKWLNGGTITMENAVKLAELLKVEPAWLIFGVDNLKDLEVQVDPEQLKQRIEQLSEQNQKIISVIVDALSHYPIKGEKKEDD